MVFFAWFQLQALDTTIVHSDEEIGNTATNQGTNEILDKENGDIVRPDGKEINKAELERKARNLNFDEEKKKDENRETPETTMTQVKTFNPGEFVKTLSFILALGLLLAVLIYLVLKTGNRSVGSSQTGLASAAEWDEAWNLKEGEADSLYDIALKEGNYRLAIRLSYLRNLRLLMDRKLVAPSPEKTNRQYARELESVSLSSLFIQITRVYETVWYGEASPDKPAFENVIVGFKEMYERAQTA